MTKVNRETIRIVAEHSNWSEKGIQQTLKKEVYNDKKSWERFLRIFFLSLGIGFVTSGVIFFFAYNWDLLHKFTKLAIIQTAIVSLVLVVVFKRMNSLVKDVLLMSASMLVGVLFAVFGQIYQTGANAYDFFLGWMLSVSLWVVFSKFSVHWLLYYLLVNTTLFTYHSQTFHDSQALDLEAISLYFLNILFWFVFAFGNRLRLANFPTWFAKLTMAVALAVGTLYVCGEIIAWRNRQVTELIAMIVLLLITYGLLLRYAFQKRILFYVSSIALSLVVILTTWLFRVLDSKEMYYLFTMWLMALVGASIYGLIQLQDRWKNQTK